MKKTSGECQSGLLWRWGTAYVLCEKALRKKSAFFRGYEKPLLMGWFFCLQKIYIYKVSNNEVTKINIIKMHLIVKVHFQKKDKVVYEKQY